MTPIRSQFSVLAFRSASGMRLSRVQPAVSDTGVWARSILSSREFRIVTDPVPEVTSVCRRLISAGSGELYDL